MKARPLVAGLHCRCVLIANGGPVLLVELPAPKLDAVPIVELHTSSADPPIVPSAERAS